MEDRKKDSSKLMKTKQPVKTEWGAQYVVFTYFQGDINSVVDEHFSRALSTAKNPQDLSRKSSNADVIVKNESHNSPAQWSFSPPWAKPYQTSAPLNLSNADHAAPSAAPELYQPSALQGIPPPAAELWNLPLVGDPNLTVVSGYAPSMPDLHMVPRSASDGKYGSLLGLLQQERCPQSGQVSADSSNSCMTGSARLQHVNQSLTSGAGTPSSDRRRDLYF